MRQPGQTLTAFWCERVVYETFEPDSPAQVSRCSRSNPAEAVRAIRVDVRAIKDTLAPVERERALRWTGHGGPWGPLPRCTGGSRAGSRSAAGGGGSSGPYARIWPST